MIGKILIGCLIFLIIFLFSVIVFADRNLSICGDGICEYDETKTTCQIDCNPFIPPQEFCGDNICQSNENCNNCQIDCGTCPSNCGNGVCESNEYTSTSTTFRTTCPEDCDHCDYKYPICGNSKCEVYCQINEFVTCQSDCGGSFQYCGNNVCDNNEDTISCPEDCEVTGDLLFQLNQKVRPLVSGIATIHERNSGYSVCSLGAIVTKGSSKYILTAGHCVTKGIDGFPDTVDYNSWVKQGDEIVGYVDTIDISGAVDAALIRINSDINAQPKTYLGDDIDGFVDTVYEGMRVFKLGKTTGLTYGTVTDITLYYRDKNDNLIRGFEVTGDNFMPFSSSGDSGSAILTVSEPHRIVGIISAGSGSNWPQDIKSEMGLW